MHTSPGWLLIWVEYLLMISGRSMTGLYGKMDLIWKILSVLTIEKQKKGARISFSCKLLEQLVGILLIICLEYEYLVVKRMRMSCVLSRLACQTSSEREKKK